MPDPGAPSLDNRAGGGRRELLVTDLGVLPYGEALALQRAVARARIAGIFDQDLLLLVEHPPVVTLGRSSKAQHLLASPALLASRGVELHEVERGGDVTFHGPGQLVGYPIIDLKRHRQDLHWFLRQVEEAIIRSLVPFGLEGARSAGQTGVWIGGRKLASIGLHARDWVTWHGFALNVTTDLSYFDLMVPCGIAEVEMTSIEGEVGRGVSKYSDAVPMEPAVGPPSSRGGAASPTALGGALGISVRQAVVAAFGDVLGLVPVVLDPVDLERVAASVAPL